MKILYTIRFFIVSLLLTNYEKYLIQQALFTRARKLYSSLGETNQDDAQKSFEIGCMIKIDKNYKGEDEI